MSETRQWVERFEALRDDLATGDLYHIQKWVQNDGALTEIAEGIARLARELEEARERERAREQAAQTLCEIYFEIAADAIGEDEVRRLRDERIDALATPQEARHGTRDDQARP